MSDTDPLRLACPLSESEMADKRREIGKRGLGSWPVAGLRDLVMIERVGAWRKAARREARRRHIEGDAAWPLITLPVTGLETAAWPELSDDIVYYLLIGDYESSDLDILSRAVRKGDRGVVAGGGIGLRAAWLARLAGTQVQAIEAREDLLARIQATLAMNQVEGVAVHGALVQEDGGVAEIGVGDSLWFSSVALAGQAGLRTVQAPGIGLRRMCETMRPDVLLIDIEGAEAELDFGDMTPHPREVIMEIHTPSLGSSETCRIAQGVLDAGYGLVDLIGQTWWFSRRGG